MQNKTSETYKSVYDFLGRAGGPETGKHIWEQARKAKVRVRTRQVKTKTYNGKIILYPESFLEEYFGHPSMWK